MVTELYAQWLSLSWESPQVFWGLPLILILILGLERRAGNPSPSVGTIPLAQGERIIRHPQAERLRMLSSVAIQGHGRWQRMRRYAAYSVVLLCVLASLAQPYRQGQRLPEPNPYREVVFILDTSVSMVLKDYVVEGQRVDRMTMLKSVMHHLARELKGNRLGVVVFSESAYTLVPLTDDYDLMRQMVERLQPAVLTGRTSQVSHALLHTGTQFSNADDKQGKLPLLVLISDIQRPYRDIDPRSVAEHLREQGFTLHTIAIGAGSEAAAEKGARGLIYQAVNFPLLEEMATRGGGRFFRARDADSLQQAVWTIQQSEKREVSSTPRYEKQPLYHWPLLMGLVWIVCLQLVRLVVRR
ncbi:MAG: VWA domain-containing protein [Gammaproteobacteria bacterium]|nr:VWA domain-containing protein [Gammaproteobacteria bacterium]